MNARTTKPQPDKPPATASGPQQVRIIGGRWRGTRLNFPAVAAIRPTPDRVRETLFNWLQPAVVGAHCLDLFAGSGALGLEALSRGAKSAVFVDQSPQVAQYLRETLTRLQCTDGEVHSGDARAYLKGVQQPFNPAFDLVFLDPPFSAAESGLLLKDLFAELEQPGRLSADTWIYLECPAGLGAPTSWAYWPRNWQLHRSKQAGQVGYHLARRTTAQTNTSPNTSTR
jgi:16S rRNA (guanine966-N2)-methyltransferase